MQSNGISGIPAYIKGFFTILTGILFIVFPDSVAGVAGLLFGLVLLVAGVSGCANYIMTVRACRAEGYGQSGGAEVILVYSVIAMILGFIFVIRPQLVLTILSLIIGVFFLIDGVVKLREATLVPNVKSIFWWAMLLLSLAIMVAGLAIILYPFSGTRAVVVFSGLCFIASGIESLVIWFTK